jgi:lipid-binding SYLF domain-containing protein
MNKTVISTWRAIPWLFMIMMLMVGTLVVAPVTSAYANDRQEATQLVEKARLTLDSFMKDENMGAFRDLLRKAEGVFIAPQVLKGAFVIGASGGTGVLLVRDKKTGNWSEPGFYTIGEASFGLQIGGQASEMILLLMTERGVNSLMGNSLKLGADAGVAAGPVGFGVSAATANLSADMLSFSRSKGLYGGISLDGAVVAVRKALNDAYYGKEVDPSDIFVLHAVRNPQAERLIEHVSKSARTKAAAMKIQPQAKSGGVYSN